ncbi:hypothetical protein Y032_0401g784 [Ancylostoma ceylanicum]|uniref:Uncharacterized protein n=1 Tax=Ancylostoma ceylanicum TaxID=53326 RepID=A0A016X505_9BILA|nr:hypothetical protein Y032_0401g784 [Ancylostoma ceylanicum]
MYRVAVKYGSLFSKAGKETGKHLSPISCDNTIEVMKRFRHLLSSVNVIGCTLHVTKFAKCPDFSALANGNIVGQ